MSSRLKVLLLSQWFPLSMSRYFERAFQRRDDVDLVTVGPYTGQWIPWMTGMNLPIKYAKSPVVAFPVPWNVGAIPPVSSPMLNGEPVKFDLVLTVDAGIHWTSKPNIGGVVAHVATDPHALNYDFQRSISDKFFNMQKVYSKPGDIYLPYAYDPTVHYPMDGEKPISFSNPDGGEWVLPVPDKINKDTDAVLIGMPYQERVEWVRRLRESGVSVIFENGPIFDEYRQQNNRAKIGLNWSSLLDMNARVFELMAMKLCPVMNIVPDLNEFFVEDRDYLAFRDMDRAVERVLWAKNNPEESQAVAEHAYNTVKSETYDKRVETILKECGLI